jgi:hypothetical protein
MVLALLSANLGEYCGSVVMFSDRARLGNVHVHASALFEDTARRVAIHGPRFVRAVGAGADLVTGLASGNEALKGVR